MSTQTNTGIVKWFNSSKGFGFIKQEVGPDIFAHYSHIRSEGVKTLADGQKVKFNVIQGEKGLIAEDIITI
jgi:CspA family cold shock protein